MTAPPSQLSLLQHIVRNLHLEPLKQGPITEDQFRGLVRGKLGLSGIAGIRAEAAEALDQLADMTFRSPQYQRGTTFSAIVDELSNIIILNYVGKAHVAVQISDVNFVDRKIAEWFQRQIAVHEFSYLALSHPGTRVRSPSGQFNSRIYNSSCRRPRLKPGQCSK
jgi:hypothetical protein